MTDWITCDCSEDYGPCERHCTVLASRDGAALHTADELCALFIDDAADITRAAGGYSFTDGEPITSDAIADAIALAAEYWDAYPSGGWADGDETPDMGQHLADAAFMVESWLPDGVMAFWEDGYAIIKVHDDCPLNYETEEDYNARGFQ